MRRRVLRSSAVICILAASLLFSSAIAFAHSDRGFRETAVIPSFRAVDPGVVRFATLFRGVATEALDIIVVAGGQKNGPCLAWWGVSNLLGLFLQERANPDRVYRLAVLRNPGQEGEIEVIRSAPGELTLSRKSDKGPRLPNLKFFYSPRAKTLLRQIDFGPFLVTRTVARQGETYLIASDGSTFLALKPSRDGWVIAKDATAERMLAKLSDQHSSTPAQASWISGWNGTEGVRFGPAKNFAVSYEDSSSGRVARSVVMRSRRGLRRFKLPQSTIEDLNRHRSTRYGGRVHYTHTNTQVFEEVGPRQVVGDRLWFAKTFYDSEGYTGIGGFGYFDPSTRKFRIFSPPEVHEWSVSAILVEQDAVWLSLLHRGEWGNSSGGLLRWDIRTGQTRRYPRLPSTFALVRHAGRLYGGTEDGIALIEDGQFVQFRIEPSRTGQLEVVSGS